MTKLFEPARHEGLAAPRWDEGVARRTIAKGGGLCHGTAGNGYAFLKLYVRTDDERLLERARVFAMHAVAQCERHAASYGLRHYSLYTGDPGIAIYLTQCIGGTAVWPGLDPES